MTQEEFKNIAPKLYELQQLSNGFSIPKNYFGTVEDAVFKKLSEEKIDKNSAFKTPDNYFSTIEDRVFDNIKSEEKKMPFQFLKVILIPLKTMYLKNYIPKPK